MMDPVWPVVRVGDGEAEMEKLRWRSCVREELLLLPLLDAPAVQLVTIFITGTALLLLIKLLLNVLPFLHQGWHLCLAFLSLKKHQHETVI